MRKTAAIVVAAAAALGLAARPAHAQTTVTCESYNGRQQVCGVNTTGGVRLVNQLSSNACVQGRTWGVARNAIWVTNGCRAEFEVGSATRYGRRNTTYGNGYGYNGYNNGYNDGTGYSMENGARLCRQAVAQQLGVRRASVQAVAANNSRNNPRYVWNAGGREGTCTFDRSGNLSVRLRR
jgi:DUF3011 family protein